MSWITSCLDAARVQFRARALWHACPSLDHADARELAERVTDCSGAFAVSEIVAPHGLVLRRDRSRWAVYTKSGGYVFFL